MDTFGTCLEILARVDDEYLCYLAIANKYWYSLYQNDLLWKLKSEIKYPQYISNKSEHIAWKTFYRTIGSVITRAEKYPEALKYKHPDKSWYEFYYDISYFDNMWGKFYVDKTRILAKLVCDNMSVSRKHNSICDVFKYGISIGLEYNDESIKILIEHAIMFNYLDDYLYLIDLCRGHHDIDKLLRDAPIDFLDYFWEVDETPSEFMANQMFYLEKYNISMNFTNRSQKDKIDWLISHGYTEKECDITYTGLYKHNPKVGKLFNIIRKISCTGELLIQNEGYRRDRYFFVFTHEYTPKEYLLWFHNLISSCHKMGEVLLSLKEGGEKMLKRAFPKLRYHNRSCGYEKGISIYFADIVI